MRSASEFAEQALAGSGPCALAHPWSSRYGVGARPDEWCMSFYESLVVDNRVDRDEDVKHGFYMIALGVLMHRLLVGSLKVLKLPSCP
ncbi:hypothetical protein GW17_00037875 [Ensete ventricosum]|nr:hypothetical protein GW17_00037875 [Ensete ventricosum]